MIERFWLGGSPAEPSRIITEVIPDGNVDLWISLTPSDCRIHLYGPATRPMYVATNPATTYLGIRFLPGQALRLADVSHPDLLDARVELDSLCGMSRMELGELLLDQQSLAGTRGVLLELFRHAGQGYMADTLCRRATAQARTLDRAANVADLARGVGVSVRSLERSFRACLGMSPKMFLRLIRLQHTLAGLSDPRQDHAELAAACGFADQAHMIHEFNALTGRSPSVIAQAQRNRFAVAAPPDSATVIHME